MKVYTALIPFEDWIEVLKTDGTWDLATFEETQLDTVENLALRTKY